MKFAFLHQHLRGLYPLDVLCATLRVSRSGYYAWRQRQPGPRAQRRQILTGQIQAVHQQHRQVYGSPRIYQVLLTQGIKVCQNTVAKLMKYLGIKAKTKRRFVPRTTDSAHQQPVADNLLDRQFTATLPNTKWVTDITYIPTDEGWLYLAGVLDLYSRKVVGWSMAQHLKSDLVEDALRMALVRRRPDPGAGLLHHSDRGVQYACADYQMLLEAHGLTCSMSGKGDCYDNAVMESFWATLKTELVHQQHYATRDQARQAIFEYIEVFYNRQRLHSSLGYQSPETFEASLS
jgi:putative transposase